MATTMGQEQTVTAHPLCVSYFFLSVSFLFSTFRTSARSQGEEKELTPACLPTPNPAAADFPRTFRKDIIRLVQTSNIHKHSATCYKYSKEKSDSLRTCRMRMPRALVQNSSIDTTTRHI